MTDLNLATQDAIYDALDPLGVTIAGDAVPVFQHVPDDTQPPAVVIGDIIAEPVGGKDGGLDRMTVEIISIYRGPAREPLYQIMAAVRDKIEGAALDSDEAILSAPVLETSEDQINEDGITYQGAQRFSLFAQPAD